MLMASSSSAVTAAAIGILKIPTPYCLKLQKSSYVLLQYLALVALKTHHKIETVFNKCSKHIKKCMVEIVNLNTSWPKSKAKSSNINATMPPS